VKKTYLSLILPVHNEEENINELYRRSRKVLEALGECEIIFINDGSTDGSLKKIEEIATNDESVRIIHFSRNFGHQAAITAGLDYASGEAVIIMDSDLQDIPELIPKMVEKWQAGYEIVYAKRRTRRDSVFKKITAYLFYRILKLFAEIDIPIDTGDFRLLDKKVVTEIRKLKEKSRFMRGLVSWAGFKKTAVLFNREKRKHGTTDYSLRKMVRFAMEGLTSFSDLPLKIGYYCGFLLVLSGLLLIVFKIFVIALIFVLVGINFLILGMQGEYIGRIYRETQNRPLYIVKKKVGFKEKKKDKQIETVM